MQADKETTPAGRLTRRSIRSFVVRNGRTTAAQTDALERLLPKFGLPYSDDPIDLVAAFGREAPTWLEIGFGNGDSLLHMANSHAEVNVIGAEVHESGIGHALIGVESNELANVRLVQHDAMEIMENMLPPASLDKVLLLFPDPWHKKRHHKRRIVQTDFLNAVARTLKTGGTLHCATDWAEYGEWMIDLLEQDDRFINSTGPGKPSERPEWRPVTRFERRGYRLGHSVTDLLYTRR
ncbi:tRNA (guanosine(46)-N7)-methyltransferase TrmB [Granulosicoccus antarcticus]|uniref:tRNA (guanine-N(7)-)-methyltransferase n=1 Tax=Granulosicoccus antarcticus IMCC3135 TaxID=1192854 RepID=A0A2Z2NME3_9GAMM|nr:tRNA (guanosine(46)-N7)-methyltransferase TrmB [Granulosicoccus antarcticus]ASJ71111.1 tRNA (guanine-N(7)-)-methyltransferase [Granulosicoccus antarcticus IMCC3135]